MKPTKLARLFEAVHAARKRAKAADAEVKRLTYEWHCTQNENLRVCHERDTSRTEASECRWAADGWRNRAQAAETRLIVVMAERDRLQAEIDRAGTEIAAATERQDGAESRLQGLQNDLARVTADWRAACERVEEVESSTYAGWPEKARESAREVADANGKLIAVAEERDALRTENEHLRQMIANADANIGLIHEAAGMEDSNGGRVLERIREMAAALRAAGVGQEAGKP